MIQDYFSSVKGKINEIRSLIKLEVLSFDMISPEMGIIKGRIIFVNGSVFDFRELITKKEHDYRFHWMDKNNKLIIRWDSAPHHPELENFPFHVHKPERTESSKDLKLTEVLEIIKKELIKEIGGSGNHKN